MTRPPLWFQIESPWLTQPKRHAGDHLATPSAVWLVPLGCHANFVGDYYLYCFHIPLLVPGDVPAPLEAAQQRIIDDHHHGDDDFLSVFLSQVFLRVVAFTARS